MNTTTAIELKVVRVFRFQDGRTVFVGQVDGSDIKFISPGLADVLVNGQVIATIELEGEMISNGRPPGGERSLSTLSPVEIGLPSSEQAQIQLRLHDMM